MSPRTSSYNAIIDAAEAVVTESGASHMTLDAVAAKAKISKGGLLHHFPTKISLLKAMIDRRVSARQELIKKIYNELPEGPSRSVKAYVLSVLHRDRSYDRMGAPLLAAIAHNPPLVKPMREVVAEIYGEFESSGIKFERAAIIALAADALLFHDILSISPFTDEQRKKVTDELFTLLEGGTA